MKIQKFLDKILTVIGFILSLAPFMALGIYTANVSDNLIADDDTGLELMLLGVFIFVGLLMTLIHIIIHEGGHLLMGLATGWKYVSFRIGSLTLVKQNGKLAWKKTTVAGTGGQCLMSPPDCEPEKCPFFLYLMGGGLANIITAGIAFGIGLITGGIPQVILNIFAVMGAGLGLSNLFPAKIGGTANDGYSIFIEMPNNPKAKTAQAVLLAAHAYLTDNDDTLKMPESIKNHIMNADYSNLSEVGTANLYVYKASLFFYEEKYDEAREIYRVVADSEEALQLFRNEAKCELAYFEIMDECNGEKIDALLDKKIMEYIKATAVYPARKRLMYAYHLIYKGDVAAAEKELSALYKTTETYPVKADITAEMREAERIKALYEQKTGNTPKA